MDAKEAMKGTNEFLFNSTGVKTNTPCLELE